ncbi:competence type IV pilus major pilin ComGC [Halalkalibacter akibai]|uniref:ComG operon protein 3 n=1 Tax=Halalkalibacter akibai (strain ATCC 43226 / DSM 21942 / CIP 109018 / JCM 9157 / 1139) TaxID=1236973 RepID=W4QVX9_HALA3|nr:competence type IV pilus major pilin ComGC [Halalkalibacter akibai]GAE36295.1 late competence protein [Halalkalibacter akibai JCM 9157]
MKTLQNQTGFTLVEMLIVLMIISVLLLIVVPNMSKNSDTANGKGCEATVKLLQAQVHAYKLEKSSFPLTLQKLIDDKYVEKITCPNGTPVNYSSSTGIVAPPTISE